jgi:C-terminal processing protease CtpA/Prc
VAKHGIPAFHGKEMHELLSITDRGYINGPLREFCNNQIEYGHIDGTTGYLRLWSFSNYSKGGDFAAGEKALEAALDEIFADAKLAALVIDVRINFGGADPYGIDIASRLANTEYVAYTKYARADPVDHNKWTQGDQSVVRPSSRPSFHGSVAELTGPLTISAGETFTQALLGRTPHVTRIGENTQGVFSDVLVRTLPNGWRFGLPNEVYKTTEGIAFDGTGIGPDIPVPVFADDDITAGKDPAMTKALEILRSANNHR